MLLPLAYRLTVEPEQEETRAANLAGRRRWLEHRDGAIAGPKPLTHLMLQHLRGLFMQRPFLVCHERFGGVNEDRRFSQARNGEGRGGCLSGACRCSQEYVAWAT